MNILTAIMDVEMLYFHTHKQVILKSNNLTISQFEVSYEVLFISFSTTLFQYFSIILEKINIIQIKQERYEIFPNWSRIDWVLQVTSSKLRPLMHIL